MVILALVHTAPILISAWILQLAVLAILLELVVVSTPTLVVCYRQLNTIMITASIPNRACLDADTGAAISVQAESWFTLAVM